MVPPQLKRSPGFPSHPERRICFPASSGKESWRSRRNSRECILHLTLEMNSRVVPPFQMTLMSQWTPDTPDSPATDSTVASRTDSKHDGGCDSPVAPREKATDPYVNPTGSLILLFLLQRRADVHVSIEMRPNTLWKPQRNPEILLDTGEETEGSGLNSR